MTTSPTLAAVSPALATVSPALAAVGVALAVGAVGAVGRPSLMRPARQPATPSAPARSSTVSWFLLSRRRRRSVVLVVFLVLAVGAGVLAAGALTAVTLLVRKVTPIRAVRRRQATIERALPEAMELLVLGVRAGLTPFQAVADLATFHEPVVAGAFSEVVRRTQRGQSFADALGALPEQLGPRAGGLSDVIATSDRHGLALGPVLDQLATEARAGRRQLDQADARKLPVRLSFPLVTCTLPSFVLLAIAPAVIAALSSLGGNAW